MPRRRRAGHHGASARRRAAHPPSATCRRSRRSGRLARAPGADVEFNIEGDPRPDLIDLVARGAAGPVHARAGVARRDHESGRLAARRPRPRLLGGVVRRLQGARRSRQSCSSIPRRRRFAGPRRLARIASSSTPSRSRGRSPRAVTPPRQRSIRTSRAADAGARARPGRQRRARSRPRQPAAVPDAAAPGRGVDRPRADQPRAVGRTRSRRAGLPGGRGDMMWR